ncbi:phage major tail tube protein [Novosphingobium sp. 9]|uniref:phage major tail tube protein n=1 Tax=Novosphingobium sp. 9 TaxID=2025349 RepID=UPI0021B682BC|nr:phage major tail tube protein [Novosphingobium sp. 9]
MGMPSKHINSTAYVDGGSYLGIVAEFEEPKLAIATDDWRGGGMLGPVKLDMGLEAMDATLTMGGHTAALIRKFGTTAVDGVSLRLVSAYRADDGSAATSVNIFINGRFSEIDLGKSKAGDATEHKYTVPLSYYRREVNGVVDIRIDMVNGVFEVDGVDRYAEIMAILTS